MIFILLSHERSGSHLLGEYLSACGVRMIDEVCNVNAVDPLTDQRSFVRYKYDYSLRERERFLKPTFQQHIEFVSGYFRFLDDLQPSANVAVDIKYGHLHQFEQVWNPLFRLPMLFQLLKSKDMKLIHLYRANVVDAAVSAWMAEERGVWHSWQRDADQVRDQRHRIDVAQIVQEATLLLKQSAYIRDEWCAGVDVLHLRYEELSAAMRGEGDAFDRIDGFGLGRAKAGWQPKLRKLGRPHHQMIENFDELVTACHEAGLGAFINP